jgi:hypothetical protein
MRTFYTGSDIEDLSDRGIRQLVVGPGITLTDYARELAEELGVALVPPGITPSSKAAAPAAPAKAVALPGKPRGCQHGPLPETTNRSTPVSVKPTGGQVVEQLVEAVSALKKRGG